MNAVLPGLVEADGVTTYDRQRFDQVAAMTPAGRNGRPDDIADVVAFLAGDAARRVAGQTIAATGGLSLLTHRAPVTVKPSFAWTLVRRPDPPT